MKSQKIKSKKTKSEKNRNKNGQWPFWVSLIDDPLNKKNNNNNLSSFQ